MKKIIEAPSPLSDFGMAGFVDGFTGTVHFRLENLAGNPIVDCDLPVEALKPTRFAEFLAGYHGGMVRAILETSQPPHKPFGNPE